MLAGAKTRFRVRLLLLERGEAGLQGGGVGAVLDGAHDSGELALDVGERPLRCKSLALGRGGELAHLCIEFINEGGDQVGRHHSLLESAEGAIFERVAAYQQRVRAGALRAVRRAAVAVGTDDCIAAATRAADQQTAQEEVAAVRTVERIAASVAANREAQ